MLLNIRSINFNILHSKRAETCKVVKRESERTSRLSSNSSGKIAGFRLSQNVAELFPGYFALVMATGIVSIAAFLLKMTAIAYSLLWLNIVFFAVLMVLLLFRCVFYFPRIRADIADYQRGPGFFTLIAGICVLGSQIFLLLKNIIVAQLLLTFGGLCWLVIIYSFFLAITIKSIKPSLDKGINGAWLIATVATQAISILCTLTASFWGSYSEILLFTGLAMFLTGCILYLLVITLIFYRFSFFTLNSGELLGAPYWINMGAAAITTLAGSTLILQANDWIFLKEINVFLKGFTLFFWCAGTWWIPLLLLLGVWKHLVKKESLPITQKGYHPTYWSMVFPLGMYTVCTFKLSEALNIDFLMIIPEYFIYIALAGWGMVFIGLLHKLTSVLFSNKNQQQDEKVLEHT